MQKITWDKIQKQYEGEWVELINYDWQDGQPYPAAGEVRVHASDRKEFYQQANIDRPKDSAILYVGRLDLPLGVIRNNLMRIS